MIISLVILAFIFVIGLVIGSFLNVVILRTVSEESIVFPASKCPKCQTPLKWYHNIPVFSYIFLKGKCAFCQEKISLQYPLVELFSAIMFTVFFVKFCHPFDELFGLSVFNPISLIDLVNYVFVLIVFGLFVAMSGTDFIEKKVASIHAYALIGVGLLYSIISAIVNVIAYSKDVGFPDFNLNLILSCPIFVSFATGVLGFIIMEALSFIGILLVKKRAFGDGDSYISAGIGTVFGALLASNLSFGSISRIMIGILLLAIILQIIATFPIFIKQLIIQKNRMTISLIFSFVIYAISYVYAQDSGWLNNIVAYVFSTLVLLALGIFTCVELLRGLKNKKQDENSGLYLPFGPAMCLSAMIFLLYL